MKPDKFARTGAPLRAPSIDPNALYLRREVKHLLRSRVGDESLSDIVKAGELRHAELGNGWLIRGAWLLDFIESRGAKRVE